MDLSLDDLINRSKGPGGGGGGGGGSSRGRGGGSRGGGGGGRGRGGRQPNPRRPPDVAVLKRGSGFSGGRGGRARLRPANPDGQWGHDGFHAMNGGGARLRPARAVTMNGSGGPRSVVLRSAGGGGVASMGRGGGGPRGPGRDAFGRKVKISNLEHSTMKDDLKELFESVGMVEDVWIDYGKDDRSMGSGGALFQNPGDAEAAVRMFNGKMIDSKRVLVEIDSTPYRAQKFRDATPW
uniref:RRM domain-containing protein n=1 Tax=Chromera velia CCMP2878 TaxID=1169474 RepID=A0A0G4GT11_9ALVE|eukprot:Cvel_5170.t1-p1 / transcript=Cvel_5170.t1 / gene=Cvel_5170 / organism=Chromera_velia_CCMP2878 / gene_product=hypothetical protein / transcript_product=hypothetical protein / location=Cvel_scaffold237:54599-59083(-) / protein_length=236 / sequence_SO=supercontig / SO=protein_coding / is_pseudo=false